VHAHGGKSIITKSEHTNGTERIAEAAKSLEADLFVNIQGDEPMLDPAIVNQLVDAFDDEFVEMATVASTVIDNFDYVNPNSVKVMIDENGFASAFRRETKDFEIGGYYHHVGMYGYRKETLLQITKLDQTEHEAKFNLEQLRALDNGIPIKVILTDYPYRGIDTEEDLNQYESNQ
jgi:3-deoxy-manno-octulosonate cytidylyltransferase (CMP-KDO synthetase)